MRRNAALIVMLAAEVGVAALALFFQRSRVAILAAFRDYGTELSPSAALALSPWLLPGAVAFAAACTLVALAAPVRRSQRAFLVGLGLMVASAALIFAVWAAFVSAFQPA